MFDHVCTEEAKNYQDVSEVFHMHRLLRVVEALSVLLSTRLGGQAECEFQRLGRSSCKDIQAMFTADRWLQNAFIASRPAVLIGVSFNSGQVDSRSAQLDELIAEWMG